MSNHPLQPDALDASYDAGRRSGLATAALALSIVSFLNLFGMEKSILALVLAVLAMRGAEPLSPILRRCRIVIGIAVLHLLTILVVLLLFQDQLAELLTLLYELN
ncbi:MAG: hypothetical protein RQ757_12210 [Pseudomonadales bacterium]|nr:hypothetical protein [Pseudomonadales bacterium]